MSVIWTDEVKEELVKFVDELVELGVPKMEAYRRFCEAKGSEFNPSSAAVQYSLVKRGVNQKQGYTKEDDRLIVFASHFAPSFGLKKRDVFRHLGEKLGKNFTAIEQRAYILARDIGDQLPEECPDDILEFLNEVLQKEQEALSVPAKPDNTDDGTALDVLGVLAKLIKEINPKDLSKDIAEITALQHKCKELEKKLSSAKEENHLLKQQLKEITQQFEQWVKQVKDQQEFVNYFVNEFASLRTLDQVTALKAFTNSFRTEVDKMGVVIKMVDEWKERFATQVKEIFEAK
jgi:hypothetical protein